ncbi:MAG: hypothetical protein NTZ03_13835 [Actinobacteria bacterium]|nr:hypothetical protein [Actinomycetota bacterium]
MHPLNIRIVVDSLLLLEGGSLDQSVFLFEDGDQSQGKGTHQLISVVHPFQLVRWTLVPVDLQAPGWIVGIDFARVDPLAGSEPLPERLPAPRPRSLIWEGYVPAGLSPAEPSPYAIQLTFGDGHRGTPVTVEGPSLQLTSTLAPEWIIPPATVETPPSIEGLL